MRWKGNLLGVGVFFLIREEEVRGEFCFLFVFCVVFNMLWGGWGFMFVLCLLFCDFESKVKEL